LKIVRETILELLAAKFVMTRPAYRLSFSSMQTMRLFVGVALPDVVRADMDTLVEPVEGLRWVPQENLHLTLRFLGDVDADKQARIEEALAGVRVQPFILPVEGIGVFPTRGTATVRWVGLGSPSVSAPSAG
jgi:2'-5' RNA ligase